MSEVSASCTCGFLPRVARTFLPCVSADTGESPGAQFVDPYTSCTHLFPLLEQIVLGNELSDFVLHSFD